MLVSAAVLSSAAGPIRLHLTIERDVSDKVSCVLVQERPDRTKSRTMLYVEGPSYGRSELWCSKSRVSGRVIGCSVNKSISGRAQGLRTRRHRRVCVDS